MAFKLVSVNSQEIGDLLDSLESEDDAIENYSPIGNYSEDNSGDVPNDLLSEEDDSSKSDSGNGDLEMPSSEEPAGQEENEEADNNSDIQVIDEGLCKRPKTGKRKFSPYPRGGKKPDPVWRHFEVQFDTNGRRVNAKCSTCSSTYAAPKVDRLRVHIEKCHKKLAAPVCDLSAVPTTWSDPTKSAQQNEISKKMSQGQLTTMLTNFNTASTKSDICLARFVYSANLPFTVVENDEFKEFCKSLKPSYKPASSKRIGTTLLEKVYEDITEQTVNKTTGRFVTIMQDGWTGQQGTPIISHCLNIEGSTTQFLNARSASVDTKDAQYCCEVLLKSISEAEEKFKCKVGACITDNARSMQSMRSLLLNYHPGMWTYGCNTHLLNLVGKELVPIDVLEDVKEIQHFFRDHTKPRETLKIMKAKQPVLPCETRWNSMHSCLKNFIDNHGAYLEIAKESTKMDAKLKNKLMDWKFYELVKRVETIAAPLVESIEMLQRDDATAADAAKYWIQIKQNCTELMSNEVEAKFTKWMEIALTPFICASYLLHPKYKGAGLPMEYTIKGQNWLAEQNPLYLSAQVRLSLRDPKLYPESLLKDDLICSSGLKASQWWAHVNQLCGNSLPIGFGDLAEKLMMLPASTSGIERCFSTMGNLLTDTRNRIDVEKAAKLCMITRHFSSKRASKLSSLK